MTRRGEAVAVLPIRSFRGLSRLSPSLDPHERAALGRALTARVLTALGEAQLGIVVVTGDDEVTAAAGRAGARVVADPGTGLDDAAARGISTIGDGPWLVVHADLPLIDAAAIEGVARSVEAGHTVLVPSTDGGTTVIGSDHPMRFAFGPGSFHRHLARRPSAVVVTDPRLAVDVDTPMHLRALGHRIPSA